MKIELSALLAIGLSTVGISSTSNRKQIDNRVPVRLAIRHADPWAVKAMLEGRSITQPEISTLRLGQQNGQSGQGTNSTSPNSNSLLKDGFLVVNPTDNSLWWYPNKS